MVSTDNRRLRDSAHLALRSIGPEGQARIRASRVLLVGVGGLGCSAAQYLAASGVQRLTLCDFDRVEAGNLARQVLFAEADVGQPKAPIAAAALSRLNPSLTIDTVEARIDAAAARTLLTEHDIALDASDNYGTRLAMNAASLAAKKPWVMGACVRMEGQFTLFAGLPGAPCYRCLYGAAPETLEDCPGAGIFAPVAGVIGAAMAHAALMHLAGRKAPEGLHLLDAETWNWRSLRYGRVPSCPACAEIAN